MIRDDGTNKRLTDFKHKCVICGKTFKGFGNNALPLKKEYVATTAMPL